MGLTVAACVGVARVRDLGVFPGRLLHVLGLCYQHYKATRSAILYCQSAADALTTIPDARAPDWHVYFQVCVQWVLFRESRVAMVQEAY